MSFNANNLDDLNELLSSIKYTPPKNRNGEDYLQITVNELMLGNTEVNEHSVVVAHTTILLEPVNDAPVITAPSHVVVTEDAVYAIGDVQLHDVDFITNPLPSALLTVTVTCQIGLIKLSGNYAILLLFL